MPTANKKISTKVISLTILIAFIPIYGYFAAYIYEISFCKHFQIPLDFIEIGFTEVLKIMAGVVPIILLGFIVWISTLFTQMFKNPVLRLLGRGLFPLSFLILGIAILKWPIFKSLIIFLVAWFVMSGSDLVFPLFPRWKIKGYKKRLEVSEKYEASVKNPLDAIVDLVMDQIGVLTFMIIFISLFALVLFVQPMGKLTAKKQRSFMIIKSNPELVVLRKYSQNFICVPFDRENKEIKKNFYLKSIDQIGEEGFEIVIDDIGPLEVAKKNQQEKKDKKNEARRRGSQIP